MLIITDRLTLREITETDLNKIHELHSLSEIDQFNTLGIPENINITQNILIDWLQYKEITPQKQFVLCIENNTNDFIGLLGLNYRKPTYKSAEIWYKLFPEFWSQGYATEVVKAILQYCFTELKLHRIEAGCATQNISSIKVLEKSGFLREGLKRKILPIRGEWIDNYFYAILEEDFFNV
ncbi:MAG TPA: GNAT family protein [Saprospiraceae bacterium]|nr:GNAT family protein [Saprospiraceae bacterium]